jgi:glycerophosphoryl diester phosphodiesterase
VGADRLTPSRFRREPDAPPLIYAHRGASVAATENTMAAFRIAAEEGADGLELDVMRCASGEVVVFHDDDLRRLAGRPDEIRATRWETLRGVELVGAGRIPLFSEVLEATAPELRINVELKTAASPLARLKDDGLASQVAELCARARAIDRVLVSSFDPLLLTRFQRVAPRIPVGLLFAADQSPPLKGGWLVPILKPAAVHPEAVLVDPARMRRWQAQGRAVNVWTVDDPGEIRALAAFGVDGIITNRPRAAREALVYAA